MPMTDLKNNMDAGRVPIPQGRFLVIGCGSIGKRHLRNLQQLGVQDIVVFDVRDDRRKEASEQFGVPVFADLNVALSSNVKAALICTPTNLHIPSALAAARAGCHLFIEKPFSDSLQDVDELVKEVKRRNLVTLIGCNFRFHPGLQQVKVLLEQEIIGEVISARAQFGQYLPDWHPWEDYRHSYSARRALGGGVLLDRIHEFDYLRWLLGEIQEVYCIAGHLSRLEIDTEDVAEMVLRFVNGTVASLHLDYVRRAYDCSLEIIGEQGVIQWWYQKRSVCWYEASEGVWRSIHWPNYNGNEMYLAEMRHFLRALAGEETSVQDVRSAKRVLEIALAAKRSAEQGRGVSL